MALGRDRFWGRCWSRTLDVWLDADRRRHVSLLLTLEGVFTALIAWLAFREHVHARLIYGVIVIALGAGLLGWSGSPTLSGGFGPLLIAGACMAWAIDNNFTRKIALNDATAIAMLKGLVAGSVNFLVARLTHAHWPTFAPAAGAVVVGFFGYGLSLVFFVLALRELGAGRTSAYFSMAPFIGAIVSIAAFDAQLTASVAVAGALMGFGVWLHLTEAHAHEHDHAPMVHVHVHVHDDHHRHEHQQGDPPGEPHTHAHAHSALRHSHPHYPDAHHRHTHAKATKRGVERNTPVVAPL